MSKFDKWLIVAALAVFVIGGLGVFFKPQSSFLAGGVVAMSRTAFTTIDGNTSSSTAAGFGGVYLRNGTSTLIADIRDVDSATLFGAFVASSSNAQLNVRFQFSDSPNCASNAASTTWYELTPYTSAISGLTTTLATSTTFAINTATSSNANTNTGGFALPIPLIPAQCVQAYLFNSNNGGIPIAVWYGIATKRAGYNISN